jgi:hypothetical protein
MQVVAEVADSMVVDRLEVMVEVVMEVLVQ